MPKFKLIIATDEWPTLDERRRNVARLLRDTADRIERGDAYGGFHFTAGGWRGGGFAFVDVNERV